MFRLVVLMLFVFLHVLVVFFRLLLSCLLGRSFRIAVFLNRCAPLEYDWLIDTDRKLPIEEGRAYYINTRKTHRTISWTNDSIHLIMNIPFNSKNVAKCIAKLQHPH